MESNNYIHDRTAPETKTIRHEYCDSTLPRVPGPWETTLYHPTLEEKIDLGVGDVIEKELGNSHTRYLVLAFPYGEETAVLWDLDDERYTHMEVGVDISAHVLRDGESSTIYRDPFQLFPAET